MICYTALLIYRLLEKKLDYKYTSSQILDTLKNMKMLEQKGCGYEPEYERTILTDELHELFKFNTDYEIISYKNIQKFILIFSLKVILIQAGLIKIFSSLSFFFIPP